MDSKKAASLRREIDHYFGFLYANGYKVREVQYSPQYNGNWMVSFESGSTRMYITSDRNYIRLELAPITETDSHKRVLLEQLIHTLTEGRVAATPYRGNVAWSKGRQLARLSRLLLEYIDQINEHYEKVVKES